MDPLNDSQFFRILKTTPKLSRRLLGLATGLCLVVIGAEAHGQADPTRLGEASNLTLGRGAGLDGGNLEDENLFAPSSPGDDDLGDQLILKRAQKATPWRATLATNLFWTNNGANAAGARQSDWVYGGRVAVGWQPQIHKTWFADVGVSQDIYRYDRLSVLNFESFGAEAAILKTLPQLGNALLFAGLTYQQITNDTFSNSVLDTLSLRVGFQKTHQFDWRQAISFNVLADFDVVTDVDALFRRELHAGASYRYKLLHNLAVVASYRFTLFDYTRVARQDTLHIAGLGLEWKATSWLQLLLSGNFAFNNSSNDFFDYEASTLGLAAVCQIRF
jgi:hypothetical protein